MIVILSDFDGTITKEDSLYNFFDKYADEKWLEVEKRWKDGLINSKECLIEEFELVKNLNEKMIDKYTDAIEIDDCFVEFYNFIKKENIEFYVVSDGVDYFINRILEKNNIKGINLITNHAEFINGKFTLSFPNSNKLCEVNSGTCKCKALRELKKKFNTIYYIGDGNSDFCVAGKADFLFAKSALMEYCKEKNINHKPFKTFKDVLDCISPRQSRVC